jgi:hypothetical protein
MLLAGPALADVEPVPFLSDGELKCQKTTLTATVDYLGRVFAARQSCFDKVTREILPPTVNCRAAVDVGTGDDATDDAITAAAAALAVAIQTTCLNVQLENLGFPGLCPDPFGPPYDSFDHEECMIARSDSIIDKLLEIEHPPFPGSETLAEDRTCQDALAVNSSQMFVKEVEARTVGCEQKRFELKIEPTVNCRAELDPLFPGTGNDTVDANILLAHNNALRTIANSCGHADFELLGFPHECPNPGDEPTFSIASLTDCMYETHHFLLIDFIDGMIPSTKQCGNCTLQPENGETCDDGDNEWVKGEVCRANCSLISLCGDPDDSGGITIRDALYILRVAVGLNTCQLALCDINGDGVINTTDALLILRVVVGLPVNVACKPPEDLVCPVP